MAVTKMIPNEPIPEIVPTARGIEVLGYAEDYVTDSRRGGIFADAYLRYVGRGYWSAMDKGLIGVSCKDYDFTESYNRYRSAILGPSFPRRAAAVWWKAHGHKIPTEARDLMPRRDGRIQNIKVVEKCMDAVEKKHYFWRNLPPNLRHICLAIYALGIPPLSPTVFDTLKGNAKTRNLLIAKQIVLTGNAPNILGYRELSKCRYIDIPILFGMLFNDPSRVKIYTKIISRGDKPIAIREAIRRMKIEAVDAVWKSDDPVKQFRAEQVMAMAS